MRARVERFGEPALLLLLANEPTHGYELIERLPELSKEDRVDVGNLYRMLRSLEDEGLVASEWSADLPGPTKRTYTLTDEGHHLLAWSLAPSSNSATTSACFSTIRGREVTMCGRHHRRKRERRAPNREELLNALEERQKDLEQEIADIHDVLQRLRDEGVTPSSEPAPAI